MIKKYTLKNLDCASCAHKIENMINQREDINEATLSFANGLLIIDSNQAIDIHELEKLIQALEPEVTIEEKDAHHHHHHEEHTPVSYTHLDVYKRQIQFIFLVKIMF